MVHVNSTTQMQQRSRVSAPPKASLAYIPYKYMIHTLRWFMLMLISLTRAAPSIPMSTFKTDHNPSNHTQAVSASHIALPSAEREGGPEAKSGGGGVNRLFNGTTTHVFPGHTGQHRMGAPTPETRRFVLDTLRKTDVWLTGIYLAG